MDASREPEPPLLAGMPVESPPPFFGCDTLVLDSPLYLIVIPIVSTWEGDLDLLVLLDVLCLHCAPVSWEVYYLVRVIIQICHGGDYAHPLSCRL